MGTVGELVIERLPASLTPWLPAGAATLIALHDVGKITIGFQKKCPRWDFFPNFRPGASESNHAKVSHAFLWSFLGQMPGPGHWGIALAGHHGRYHSDRPACRIDDEIERDWADSLRGELAEKMISRFGELSGSNPDTPTDFQIHWFTGLITFCDWIGSDESFFPPTEGMALRDRACEEAAQDLASNALDSIQWGKSQIIATKEFEDLFPFPPNSLQQKLLSGDCGPGLYLVEATMGMGKTEAALALARERWISGEERGLYFALPTQLTSNRIFERIEPFLGNALESPEVATLAHSNSWLNDHRSFQINASNADAHSLPISDAERWYHSGRKALLASYGVGTIDQALMSVLSVRYASLRFFALTGKTVILDEVHSFDPYTFELICRLVEELVKAGSTVVVLSATLTHSARRKLISASRGELAHNELASEYPLLTKVRTNQPVEFTPVPVSDPAREIALRHVTVDANEPLPDALLNEIAEAANQGACVLVIRNTVRLAQDTYRALAPKLNGKPAALLHSRFPLFRREELEDKWVGCLEKKSKNRPNGCVLVSTQIVEQSVDIDADLLVTDLAPSELILQRIGRLHRHENTPRPAQFIEPECWIIHPEVTEKSDPKQLKRQLGPSAFVYPPPALLQSESVLLECESVRLPDDIRNLLEKSQACPKSLSDAEQRLREAFQSEVDRMLHTALTRSRNPLDPHTLDDDENSAQTRWSIQPVVMVILLQKDPVPRAGGEIELTFLDGSTHKTGPNQFDPDLARLFHKNVVKTPAYLFPGLDYQKWQCGYFFEPTVFAVVEFGRGGKCELVDNPIKGKYRFEYSAAIGLVVEPIEQSGPPDSAHELEECRN